MASEYKIVERGQPNTTSYRAYLQSATSGELLSPFHDIPLVHAEGVFNAVIEIPRWTNAKMEINKTEALNPIVQDVKNGKLRFVNNVFPHRGYIWNYGALPQTWEDPNERDETTGCNGDNDPLDVCEIGGRVHARGAVVRVKVLGALGLIDEGEADWKIICIDVSDPLAAKLNDIGDVEAQLPGLLEATRDWFRIYKVPTGKPANKFAADGKFFDREFALAIVHHEHAAWQNLIKGGYKATPEKQKGISLACTQLDYAAPLNAQQANAAVEQQAQPFNAQAATLDPVPIDTVHYIDRSKL